MPIQYDTDVQFIKGVGPKLASLLSKRYIYKVKDFLEWYPRAYEDRRKARDVKSLQPNEIVSLVGNIVKVSSQSLGRSHRKMYSVLIKDQSGIVSCKFFRVPYKGYFDRFKPGTPVRVIGKTTLYRNSLEFHHPDIRDFEESENEDQVVAIYTETEGLSPRKLRSMFQTVFSELKEEIPDHLPMWLKTKYNLVSKKEALKNVHLPPKDVDENFLKLKSKFHHRIIFDEFFWLELYMAAKKTGVKKEVGPQMEERPNLLENFSKSLPFTLTNAQKKSLNEIIGDMKKPNPMHRLVQGDVGSGKTMVALMAALFASANGYQTAIMVPTEILANQHYKNAKKLFEPLGIEVGILTGMQGAKDKRENLENIKNGKFKILIGTHALIQEGVDFYNLGLAVIDEQHRFGVGQRMLLKQKGYSPHFLVMTATPIPRTLAMTLYGDLDVSVIDELPKGRLPIVTKMVFESKRKEVMKFMSDQIRNGRQAYIIYPLVEESEKMDLKDAVSQFESLKAENPHIRFGILHGRMKESEKDQIMQSFRNKELDVLVSTTVIEVGVDVPNANLMIIEHAERFGLSQLHQLRGRVGRGEHKSYCVLMLSYAVSEDSRYRAEVMVRTNNGFEIADEDMKIRGPGEILGTRQSGLTGFKMANLVTDVLILQDARQAAFEIFQKDPDLKLPEHQALKEELFRAHGITSLAGVG